MEFTEFSVIAQRAELNRQMVDAELGAAVQDLRRRGRDQARMLRRQRLAFGFAKLGDALKRYVGLRAVPRLARARRSHYTGSIGDQRPGTATPPYVD